MFYGRWNNVLYLTLYQVETTDRKPRWKDVDDATVEFKSGSNIQKTLD